MRPLIVPTDTVRFSTIKSTTRPIPAKAMSGTQSKTHILEHSLHADVSKDLTEAVLTFTTEDA